MTVTQYTIPSRPTATQKNDDWGYKANSKDSAQHVEDSDFFLTLYALGCIFGMSHVPPAMIKQKLLRRFVVLTEYTPGTCLKTCPD